MRTMPSGLISATQQEKKKHTTHDTRDIQNINEHYQFLRIVLLLTSPASMPMHRLTDIHAHALSMALWVTHASGAGGCPFTNLHFHSLLEIWVLQHCVPLQLPTALWGSCLQGPCRHIKVGPHMWPPPGSRQLVEAHRKAAVLQGNVWRCQTRPWLLLFLVPSFLMMQFYFILFFSS